MTTLADMNAPHASLVSSRAAHAALYRVAIGNVDLYTYAVGACDGSDPELIAELIRKRAQWFALAMKHAVAVGEAQQSAKKAEIAIPRVTPQQKVYWAGPVPTKCDLSGAPITHEFVDGRTRQGSWGNMHPDTHRIYGVGCGTGNGQRYRSQPDGRWLKVEG